MRRFAHDLFCFQLFFVHFCSPCCALLGRALGAVAAAELVSCFLFTLAFMAMVLLVDDAEEQIVLGSSPVVGKSASTARCHTPYFTRCQLSLGFLIVVDFTADVDGNKLVLLIFFAEAPFGRQSSAASSASSVRCTMSSLSLHCSTCCCRSGCTLASPPTSKSLVC